MSPLKYFFFLLIGGLLVQASLGAANGLIAEWTFDEGRGDVAKDTSGNGHNGKLSGATWSPQGKGFAIMLDGVDDYISFDDARRFFERSGPLTFEMWVKPTRKAHGMSCLIGESLSSYLLTYYNTELCQLYIGDGGNSVRGKLALGKWNHVVTSFDGTKLNMWINGRSTGSNDSRFTEFKTDGKMVIGTAGQDSLPKFKGMLDNVRIYNRALTGEEATAIFLAEAADHDFELKWFSQPKITPYYYLDRGEIVLEAEYRWLQPLKGKGRFDVTLANAASPEEIIRTVAVEEVPTRYGTIEAAISSKDLPDGDYVIRATLEDEHGKYPSESFTFSLPGKSTSLPDPAVKMSAPLPVEPPAIPFKVAVTDQGGFRILTKNKIYPFQTRISWPQGDYNQLSASSKPAKGEDSWKVQVRRAGAGKFQIAAGGDHYGVRRQIEVFADHVQVKDEYTNKSKEDIGLLIYNETPLAPGQVKDSFLSGYERIGRQVELTYPDYGPSLFFTDETTGMGIVPIDDVFVIQGVTYVDWQGAAGVCTEKFALAPGASYTLEWAVYPTASGDYYDFINAFRTAEGRISTVDAAAAFITTTPHVPTRRELANDEFIEYRQLKYGLMHSISEIEDDTNLHLEGIETFRDFPNEMNLIREQIAGTHALYPKVQMLQHIAHSLYCTNKPEQFSDSRVIGPDGKQATWGNGEAFGPQRQAEGWRWWVFYPTPGNSFHDAMMKSVDVMMDEVGLNGGFMDGFLAGYGGMWTYDRWDGHSAIIDPNSKTITRKLGSVMLLSQPSMIEYARKIRDKGGSVVAMHTAFTRSIANEKYVMYSNESASGPELHLAPSVLVLGNHTGFESEADIYRDILSKLKWGELYIHYVDGRPLTHRSMASYQYPITFEEIRSGMVRGPERIVTMNSGVYAWPGKRDLHLVHKFDPRGMRIGHEYVTTIDADGVRTEVDFSDLESAVIEPVPVELACSSPVNAQVVEYGASGVVIRLNGQGNTTLTLRSGGYAVDEDMPHTVSISGVHKRIETSGETISIPVTLNGETEVNIAPANPNE